MVGGGWAGGLQQLAATFLSDSGGRTAAGAGLGRTHGGWGRGLWRPRSGRPPSASSRPRSPPPKPAFVARSSPGRLPSGWPLRAADTRPPPPPSRADSSSISPCPSSRCVPPPLPTAASSQSEPAASGVQPFLSWHSPNTCRASPGAVGEHGGNTRPQAAAAQCSVKRDPLHELLKADWLEEILSFLEEGPLQPAARAATPQHEGPISTLSSVPRKEIRH